DGYSAYAGIGGAKVVHAGCWSHARRKLFDAVKLNAEDRIAMQLVARVDELFAVDAEARHAALNLAARHALRQQRCPSILDLFRKDLETARKTALPASALGKAVNYALSQWSKLIRFLEYPQIELSNNLAENSMRPLVLGRKNWIHVGSEQAGP